ncbi:MAG: DNA-directed RNA polymerase subunit D [Candidatus Geothermarchaeales archaeon]
MRTEVKQLDNRTIHLTMHDVSVAVANSIRRAAIAMVPTMAIDAVFFYENSSVMNDQVLAHRLGLIPLTTNLEDYVPNDECDCQSDYGCPKCSVTMTLDVASVDDVKVVTSGDLVSQDSSVVPVTADIPIVKLAPGEKITTEMRALIGRGAWHAKWQPVSRAVAKEVNGGSSVLVLESLGQLPPKELVLRSLSVLSAKLGELEGKLAIIQKRDEDDG